MICIESIIVIIVEGTHYHEFVPFYGKIIEIIREFPQGSTVRSLYIETEVVCTYRYGEVESHGRVCLKLTEIEGYGVIHILLSCNVWGGIEILNIKISGQLLSAIEEYLGGSGGHILQSYFEKACKVRESDFSAVNDTNHGAIRFSVGVRAPVVLRRKID